MYIENQKIKQANSIYLTILKQISNWSYIVEMRQLDSKNKVVVKGNKVVTEDELNSGKIGFFVDKNAEKKRGKK